MIRRRRWRRRGKKGCGDTEGRIRAIEGKGAALVAAEYVTLGVSAFASLAASRWGGPRPCAAFRVAVACLLPAHRLPARMPGCPRPTPSREQLPSQKWV